MWGGTLEWFVGTGKAGDEAQAVQCHMLTQQILGTGSSVSPFFSPHPLPPQPYFHLPDGMSCMAGRKKAFCGSWEQEGKGWLGVPSLAACQQGLPCACLAFSRPKSGTAEK